MATRRPAGDNVVTVTEPAFEDRRLSFGAWATTYADHRPGYPTDAVTWVLDGATRPVREVADVGAGTGALTRTLVDLQRTPIACEPDLAMLDELGRRMPGVEQHMSYAETLPLADDSVDAVVVGQAWHWFDHAAASTEFARVVRPGGVLGLLWNLRDVTPDWARELADLIGGEDTMQSPMRDEEAATYVQLGEGWGQVELRRFHHEVEMDADSLVALIATYSYVTLRPDAEDVYAAVRELTRTHPDLAGRDRFPLPYVTTAYRAVAVVG